MSTISPDFINRLSGIQNQIWQTVSATVSEAAEGPVTFNAPLTVAAKTPDLVAEFTGPVLAIQFAFAALPENIQVVLVPTDTVEMMASNLLDDEFKGVDDNLVSSMRTPFEAIVQGICLAVGNVRNETVVASGLSVRYLPFSWPINLQRSEELVRVQVAISLNEQSGTTTWLMDSSTAAAILNVQEEEESDTPFPQAQEGHTERRAEDSSSLELLMDIPLEISVELGRVRMLVKDVLDLGTGSIVEIDKLAGEPVDVMVNGRPVARGEVVVIEDNFGVRITEILNPHERLNKLGEAA